MDNSQIIDVVNGCSDGKPFWILELELEYETAVGRKKKELARYLEYEKIIDRLTKERTTDYLPSSQTFVDNGVASSYLNKKVSMKTLSLRYGVPTRYNMWSKDFPRLIAHVQMLSVDGVMISREIAGTIQGLHTAIDRAGGYYKVAEMCGLQPRESRKRNRRREPYTKKQVVDIIKFLSAVSDTPGKFPKTKVFRQHGFWTVYLKLKEFGGREHLCELAGLT